MISLEDFLTERFRLPPILLQQVTSFARPFKASEEQFLLQPGQVSNCIYFVETGVVREFEDDPTEPDTGKTTWLLAEGNWLYSIESFLLGRPAVAYLQTLEPTSGYYFLKTDIDALVGQIPVLASIETALYKEYLIKMEYRNRLHRIKSGAGRLTFFEHQQPEIQNRVKLKYVASYLNLTPTQLSRLRAQRRAS